MMSGRLNINEQLKNYVPTFPSCNMTITLITTVSADLMAIFLPVCSLQLEANIPMIVAVTPAMTGIRLQAYLQTLAPQTDLQHLNKHLKQNGTIGLPITYLQELQTLTRPPSRHTQLGTPTIIYLTMEPLMLSASMSLINDKISVSSTLVPIVSYLTTTPGLKIPTQFR